MIYIIEALILLAVIVIAWLATRGKGRVVPLPAATYDGPIEQYQGGNTPGRRLRTMGLGLGGDRGRAVED